MKRLFSTDIGLEAAHVWLAFLRIGVAALMLTHGIPKLMKIINGEMQFADPLGIGPEVSLILVTFSEAICSILIFLGLGTRLAAITLIISCSVAAFVQHSTDPFSAKEMLLLYILIYLTLLVLGGGKYSVDSLINPPRRRR
ncbi:DoxX family protein [Telluribacter sp. SYSU D00476]|uniref:DoxX family protein n=1 Tax=Telluribacter sp. SYSU D00476 TaxID=2811430 RepID=UPI001FF69AC8|nr:DoxX family protein [Telluribacter sp. SYSU D00476]